MNVYDFDRTLYRGNSTVDFLRFCLRRHPDAAIALPRTALAGVACMGLRAFDKTRFKATLYRFLPRIPDIEREVELFWQQWGERNLVSPCLPHYGDLVVSASPEFLLRGICERRGLALIASKVDPHTGHVLGPNCSNAEKVARFRSAYPMVEIDCFYSDSHDDDPLASLAHEAFLVKGDKISPWSKSTTKHGEQSCLGK